MTEEKAMALNPMCGTEELSPQMKTFYDKVLIKNALPNMVHDQFGQRKPIPQHNGKTIEFRRLNPFAKTTTPLTEGVTPDGQNLEWGTVTATVKQYGDYVTTSDVLDMTRWTITLPRRPGCWATRRVFPSTVLSRRS